MASIQTAGGNARLQWWAKIALWTLVIAFGYLYLSAIPRSKNEEPVPAQVVVEPSQRAESAAQTGAPQQPGPAADEAAPDLAGAAAAVSDQAPASEPAPASAESEESAAPARAAESAVFADTLMKSEPVLAESDVRPATPEAPSESSAAVATPPPAPAPEEAVAPSAAPAPAPAAAPSQPAATETAEERRARIMSEYEKMRRQYPPKSRPSGGNRYYYPGYGSYYYPGQGSR